MYVCFRERMTIVHEQKPKKIENTYTINIGGKELERKSDHFNTLCKMAILLLYFKLVDSAAFKALKRFSIKAPMHPNLYYLYMYVILLHVKSPAF